MKRRKLTGRKRKPGKRGKPELSVVISALNEERRVKNVLTNVLMVLDKHKINGEVVFLDDHSTDKTGEIADALAKKKKRLRVIHRRGTKGSTMRGVGNSLREGFDNVKADYIISLDCDSHSPVDIPRLWKEKDKADLIIGSRYIADGKADMPLKRIIISRSFNLLSRVLTGVNVKDLSAGYKLYSKKVLKHLKLKNEGFGIHVEVTLKNVLKGYTVKEVPIYYRRGKARSTLNYGKEFPSYMKPLLWAIKERITSFLK